MKLLVVKSQCNTIRCHVLHFVYMQFNGRIECVCCVFVLLFVKSLLPVSSAAAAAVFCERKNSATIPKIVGFILFQGGVFHLFSITNTLHLCSSLLIRINAFFPLFPLLLLLFCFYLVILLNSNVIVRVFQEI